MDKLEPRSGGAEEPMERFGNIRRVDYAPKARYSKAQGGRASESELWNPGSGDWAIDKH